MRVLIVEDDANTAELVSIANQMRWPEAELLSTHMGEKAVELVESEAPDIVILDLGLPDISGFEVLRQIRSFSSVPVIVLTGKAEEVDKVKGLELGADDYLAKPFGHLELLARVRAVMRRQGTLPEEPPPPPTSPPSPPTWSTEQ